MIGTVTPTLGNRHIFLDNLKSRLERQTLKADVSVFVDYPETGKVDIKERFVKGIKECFDKGCDFVLMMEDDDYYPLTYIEEMYNAWVNAGKPVLMGVKETMYYHIVSNRHVTLSPSHCSAYCSAVSVGCNYNTGEDSSPYYDIALWKANKGVQVNIQHPPLGIKHGFGTCGGVGHDPNSKLYQANIDLNLTLLKSRLDAEGFDFYNRLAGNRVGAVIVAYETPDLIEQAVKSIVNCPRLEVVIVDNSGVDSPCWSKCDELAQLSNVRVIHTGQNLYHGRGLHLGITNLKTEYVLVMDSDAICLDISIINDMCKVLADANVYGVGCNIENVPEGSKRYGVEFDYLEPYFAMFKRATYMQHSPFVHHGAPWCQTMLDIYGQLSVKVVDKPNRVKHLEAKTQSVAGRDWLQGWHVPVIKRQPQPKKQVMIHGSKFVIKKGVTLLLDNSPIVINSETVTDALAMQLLEEKPHYIRYFDEVPTYYAKAEEVKKEKKITMICFVYNERKYLPHVVEFWRKQNIHIYVIDNHSNDGTWEWLQEQQIDSHRFDTKEMFELAWLQAEVVKTLHAIKPDWIIYGAADLYYAFDKPIKEVIDEAESEGFNQIRTHCWFAKNTNEKRGLPLMNHYYHFEPFSDINMISKYEPTLKLLGDHITLPNARAKFVDGMILNYGGCKTIEEQEVKLERRKKAWENGMHKGWGVHYPKDKEKNWIFDKTDLVDIRKSPYFKYLQKMKDVWNQ